MQFLLGHSLHSVVKKHAVPRSRKSTGQIFLSCGFCRPVARGCDAPPKSAKRSTFSHKMGQKWGFCSGVEGVRFKKFTFWIQKVPFFGVPHPPKIDPGYGPAASGLLAKCALPQQGVFLLKVRWYFLHYYPSKRRIKNLASKCSLKKKMEKVCFY